MKLFKRIVLGLLSLALLLVLSVVAVQTWYHFTPIPLTAEAKALNDRAAKLPTVTENGYRLYGFHAPRDGDPVAMGRCLVVAHATGIKAETDQPPPMKGAEDKVAYDAYWKARSERQTQRESDCRKGGAPLALPKSLEFAKINFNTTRTDLAQLAGIAFEPVLLGRAEQVWAGEARRVGASFDAPIPLYTPLVAIERWRIAKTAVAWDAGDRTAAVNQWSNTIRSWVKSADDTLIDAMISTSVLSQTLIVMQQSAAMAPTLDEATANAMLTALTPMAAMPHAVADSLVAEWQSTGSVMDVMNTQGSMTYAIDVTTAGRWADRLARLTFDTNDTINRMARGNVWSQRAILEVAQGGVKPELPQEWQSAGCDTGGGWGYLCLPYTRNPVGRITAFIAMPFYVDYGIRVADLMSLVNATRLTIHARRQGLTGDALVKWVGEAPPEMRSVGTRQPFRYDPTERKLHIELQTKSTILGDKTYALPL